MSADGANGRALPPLWRSLLIAGAFPIAVLAISLWLTVQLENLLSQHRAVERTYQQQVAIAELISDLKDAETGQRGFVITGNPAFLEPYSRSRSNIDGKLRDLEKIFAGENRVVRGHVGRIATLVPDKFEELQRVLDVQKSDGQNAAAALISKGIGKRLMDQIRSEESAIAQYQDDQLARQLAAATRKADDSKRIYLLAVLVITAISLISAYVMWNNRRARHKASVDAFNAGTRQMAIFNSTLNAIILINPSGSIEVMNPAAEQMFGYPATDLLRRDISIIVDLAPGEGSFLDRLGLGPDGLAKPFHPLLLARRADNETISVEVALGLMPLEDGMHVVAVFSDVSAREKVEEIKDQFLSTVSHELRTPLTSIVGSLGLLKIGVADDLSEQAHRLVEIAENNANRLIRIVNDILDAEKLQSGQMAFTFAPIDLRDVVGTAIQGMTGLASTKGIALQFDRPEAAITVRGDAERLMQVVGNLVSNAVKFAPHESEVDISLSIAGNHARVAVADKGAGIPEDLRARLFTRFAQAAGAANTGTPGTGLGLAISRDIVRSHDGKIGFEDGVSGGTVFAFELPLWSMSTAQADFNSVPRLLVYADSHEVAALSSDFAKRSIKADIVQNIAEATAAVKQRRYLAMIVDFQFADGSAPAVIQAIRAEPLARSLPIIAIASEAAPVDPAEMAAIDIIDWISKPIASEQLDDAVAAAIARASVDMPLVLHVDDDLDTLAITGTALSGLARVAQATDLASARSFLAKQRADILIIDIALPDGSGLDLIADLAGSDRAGTPVIIYSAQDSDGDLRQVEAVLTKSKKSLPNLVETILEIRERKDGGSVK